MYIHLSLSLYIYVYTPVCMSFFPSAPSNLSAQRFSEFRVQGSWSERYYDISVF